MAETSIAPAENRMEVDVELVRCWTNEDVFITHRALQDGVPVLHWQMPLTLRTAACVGGTATYEIELVRSPGVVFRQGTMADRRTCRG